ncbi:MAG: phosphomannomutase/phosphoglucomutase [Candidatus Aegiribacteria sp.]|nr:phosphomannomutase/phosphoglucomutase [Candidatus Aegiribacteria sp.]
MKAFKAYDIRGVYGKDFNGATVYRIGFFLPGLLSAERVLVGYDCRKSTPELFQNLVKGITDAGADVFNMGLATTPMVYFATATHGFKASVQITASHNPGEYNGLKISRGGALPVGYDSGLKELEAMVENEDAEPSELKGKVIELPNIKDKYLSFLIKFRGDYTDLKFGIDCSNGMASILVGDLFGSTPEVIYDILDGTFPNHPPNPLDEKNTGDLKELVIGKELDIGVIFDGDADRVMFVDDRGRFVRPDLITAVLGLHYLQKNKGYVLCDIRTSRAVIEYIEKLGGRPFMWKVGHSNAKIKMKELKAIYGGELAGHYYFSEFFNCDSGMLAALLVLNIVVQLKERGRTFSSLIDSISTYANSGEVNFRIDDKEAAMESLKNYFTSKENPDAIYDFDGYRIEFPDWWFSIRPSNTEPYLRLVTEAINEKLLESKLNKIRQLLESGDTISSAP